MDDLESRNTNDTSDTASSGKLSIAFGLVGVIGILVGAVALIMANSARKEASTVRAELEALKSSIGGVSSLEEKVNSFEERLVAVGERTVQLNREFGEKLQRIVDQVGRELQTNRTLVAQLSEQLKETQSTVVSRQTKVEPTGGSGGTAPASVAGKPEEGFHLIEQGDTLGKLAARYGVTVDAIIEANPGIEPKRLQIGQKVKIP